MVFAEQRLLAMLAPKIRRAAWHVSYKYQNIKYTL